MSAIERIRKGVPLATHTTLRVGGDAAYFVETSSEAEVREVVQWARAQELSWKCIGGGSNILVCDSGFNGLVIRQVNNEIYFEDEGDAVRVTGSAGVPLDILIEATVEHEVWGLENLSGIPGSVGATPIQNVGAYGVEVGDLIDSVRVYDSIDDAFVTLNREACAFGYRDSFFKSTEGSRYSIVAVTFVLSKQKSLKIGYHDLERFFKDDHDPDLRTVRNAICMIRSRKFPDWHEVGTAGSFFKNPIITQDAFICLREKHVSIPGFDMGNGLIKIPFGYVLDKIFQLKGVREGNVGLYKEQALVLVSYEGATADEIEAFAASVIERAYRELNLTVEREVIIVC